MFAVIGTVDNYTILPSPVLDDADPKGYRIEQRPQVTLKLAANERQQYTVEFRRGDESQAPSTDLLTKWLESGELVQAYCAGLAARPFVHAKDKTYQRRGGRSSSATKPPSSTPLSSSPAPPWRRWNLSHHWRSK
jgi:hypothetical protein